MRVYYEDEGVRILCGSALGLEIEPVQCVVTSPPYWGLRKYEGEQELVWGGNPECEHEWASVPPRRERHETDVVNQASKQATNTGAQHELPSTNACLKCGAWRGAFGLEPTPELYVEHTVLFLRAIRDVLRDDGVVFWNVGDRYNSIGGSFGGDHTGRGVNIPRESQGNTKRLSANLKPKDLCMIPARVALAAQADGWWVRSDIIWAKPNPMPESVKDRPTSAYEHIFMLTKSQNYYWDADAVREAAQPWPESNHLNSVRRTSELAGPRHRGLTKNDYSGVGRNIRDVWTIPTQPSGFKHYAAFPEELPTRCIKAATRPGDTVLDPFCGTGRTLYAALKLGRKAVGVDISETYCEMARKRVVGQRVLV